MLDAIQIFRRKAQAAGNLKSDDKQTFIVNHYGDVHECDLGPDTSRIASEVTAYNPGEGWSKVAD